VHHESFIHRCLELAALGRKRTGTNPLVGALLVRNGLLIAEAWHEEFGGSHAERLLLQNFEQEIRSTDTLYVNLEPCCHEEKKTLPCTSILLERGVKRVVVGMVDPNPKVAGQGIALLRSRGVQVVAPVERVPCERLNRGFVSLMTKARPWITLHNARTLDGRIANADGSPLKITSPQQDAWAHEHLRAMHDAILVGVGTIIADDPQLTVRLSNTKVDQINPLRIVLDPNLRLPLDTKIVTGKAARGTVIVCAESLDAAGHARKALLEERGVVVALLPLHSDGHFVWDALWEYFRMPLQGFHGIASVLVEGGPGVWQAFRGAGMVDEEVTLVGSPTMSH
jgi:diaminohydroxyphosphoribosylaminopyrimidine deaminase/5-amino-6-(5-phosphoribosylamino)uracil reductase